MKEPKVNCSRKLTKEQKMKLALKAKSEKIIMKIVLSFQTKIDINSCIILNQYCRISNIFVGVLSSSVILYFGNGNLFAD